MISKLRAFAKRTGLDAPAPDAKLADLVGRALDATTDDAEKTRIAASAGAGMFARIEAPTGFPDAKTDDDFTPDGLNVHISPAPPAGDDLGSEQASLFKVDLCGRTFVESGPSIPVDWRANTGNIASTAHVTVSSGDFASGLVDGKVDGYPGPREAEWAAAGEKAGAWAKLAWATPQKIGRIVLFDRINLYDQVTAGRIDFSDGTSQTFGKLENDASRGTEIEFPAKTVTWIKITLTAVSKATQNRGLSEIAVFPPQAE
jgi:hypothetical protein